MALIQNIYQFIKNALNVVMDGSFERAVIISQMNKSFKEQYLKGESARLVSCSITMGDPSFKHEMSASFMRSGFMMTILNDNKLKLSEAHGIAQYVLENDFFIKKLMTLGFDTLLVRGQSTQSIRFKLSDYASLNGFFLE